MHFRKGKLQKKTRVEKRGGRGAREQNILQFSDDVQRCDAT